jgi:hypothetical protein
MLRGNSLAKLDEKGRLKLPAAFRALLEPKFGSEYFVTSLRRLGAYLPDGRLAPDRRATRARVVNEPVGDAIQVCELLCGRPRWMPRDNPDPSLLRDRADVRSESSFWGSRISSRFGIGPCSKGDSRRTRSPMPISVPPRFGIDDGGERTVPAISAIDCERR